MSEITFTVSPCEGSSALVASWDALERPCEKTSALLASWDAPEGGGITTQGESMDELRANVREAVACHFKDGEAPARVRLHFAGDALLQTT